MLTEHIASGLAGHTGVITSWLKKKVLHCTQNELQIQYSRWSIYPSKRASPQSPRLEHTKRYAQEQIE